MVAPKNPMNKKARAAAGKRLTAAEAKRNADQIRMARLANEATQLLIPIPGPQKIKKVGKATVATAKGVAKAGKAVVRAAKGKPARKPNPPGMAKHYTDQMRAILAEPDPAKRKRMSRNIKPFVPTIPGMNKTRKKKKGK